MYYVMHASAPSLHRESTDSLIIMPTVHRETLSAELLKYAFFDETTSLARPSYRN